MDRRDSDDCDEGIDSTNRITTRVEYVGGPKDGLAIVVDAGRLPGVERIPLGSRLAVYELVADRYRFDGYVLAEVAR